MAEPCIYTFKGKEYSYDEFTSMLHDGLLDDFVKSGNISKDLAMPENIAAQKPMAGEKPVEKEKATEPSGKFVGLSNEETATLRKALGLNERPSVETKADEKTLGVAMDRMAKDPNYTDNLVQDYLDAEKNGEQFFVDDAGLMALAAKRVSLETQVLQAESRMEEAQKSGDKEAEKAEQKNIDRANEKLQLIAEAAEATGTTTARALRIRQLLMSEDYSLSGVKQMFKKAKGVEATPAQQAEAKAKVKELEDVNKALKEKVDQIQKALDEAAKKAESKAPKAPKGTGKTYTEKAKVAADKFRTLKSKPFVFKDSNGNEIEVHTNGPTWNSAIEIGAKAIEESGKIADKITVGVKAAINHIKDQDWYKKLSEEDKARFESELKDHYTRGNEETIQKKITSLETKLKNLEEGIKKEPNKKLTKEEDERIVALKDRIENFKKEQAVQAKITKLSDELSNIQKGIKEPKTETEKKIEDKRIQGLKDKIKDAKKEQGTLERVSKLNQDLEDLQNGVKKEPTTSEKRAEDKRIAEVKQKIADAKSEIATQKKIAKLSEELSDAEKGIKKPKPLAEKKIEDERIQAIKDKIKDAKAEQATQERLANLQEQLEDIEAGVEKETAPREQKAEDARIAAKKEEIAQARKEQAIQKRVADIEQEIEDAKNGVAKTPSEKQVQDDRIVEAQQRLAETRQELRDQQKSTTEAAEKERKLTQFEGKTDNKFTIQEAKDIFDHMKENYIDQGVELHDAFNRTANDLGLSNDQILEAFKVDTKVKSLTNQAYLLQNRRMAAKADIKRWIDEANRPPWEKKAKQILRLPTNISVFGHGTVGMITHAAELLRDPKYWRTWFPAFARQFKYSFGGIGEAGRVKYELAMAKLKDHPRYSFWKRNGLAVDPAKKYDDYIPKDGFFGKAAAIGDRGFNVLKEVRLDLAESMWNELTPEQKAAPGMAKMIAETANNMTGTNQFAIKGAAGTIVNEGIFAPKLMASRFNRILKMPVTTLSTGLKSLGGYATPVERAEAKFFAKSAGRQIAFYMGTLAASAGIQQALGSKNKVNFTDPSKSDWLKPKIGNKSIDATGGMLSTVRFLGQVGQIIFTSKKDLPSYQKDRKKAMESLVSQFVRQKLSPTASTIYDFASGKDYEGNVMPWREDKPSEGKHKLTFLEYLLKHEVPIPVAEAVNDIAESMKEAGVSAPTTYMVIMGIMNGAFQGGTGIKIKEQHVEKHKSRQ